MTAFGRAQGDSLDWEIRSVNHRYLEIAFRLPEPFRDLEPELRELAASRIQRGKIDATLRFAAGHAGVAPRLNERALAGLLAAVEDIRRRVPSAGALDPMEILRFPGVVQDDAENLARFKAAAQTSFCVAVDDLVDHRQSEGAKLDRLLRERLAVLEETAASIRDLIARQGDTLRERLQGRVHELAKQVDRDRLEQEIALLAQKADVAEELDRLDIHVAETRRSLDSNAPCGRRLDFLMQELNREANTLAAKSLLPQAAHLAVDLKVVIEQMREQAQNVE
ncbi:MAG: YicC family protein [Gammaproteobacteria bacterium]|nr:YicC family protein [Gammaproteobacteria bacterium]